MTGVYKFGRRDCRPGRPAIWRATAAIFFLAAAAQFNWGAAAGPQRISGRAVAAEGGRPLAGVLVSVRGGRETATTGPDGTFAIDAAAAGPWVLTARAAGFAECAVRADGSRDVLIRMTADPAAFFPSEEVVVESAGLDRAAFEMPYAGRSLSRERIQEENSNSLNDAAAAVPGLSFVGGGYHSAPALRGLARNRLVLLVDGVRTASIRTIGGHLGFIHPFAVEALEVVKGPFSTVYGHDAMAGVLNVETLSARPNGEGFGVQAGGLGRYESASRGPSGAFYLKAGTPAASVLVSYGRIVEEDYRLGGGGILPRSGFSLASLLAKAELRPGRGHRLEILYLRTDGRDIGKASGDPALQNVHPTESNDVAALSWEWKPGGRLFNGLEARLSRGLFTLAADFRTVNGPRTVQSLRDLGEDDYGFFLKALLTPSGRTALSVGVDGYFQENQRITGVKNIFLAGREAPVSSVLLDEVPPAATRDVGAFVQGTISLGRRWDLVFGARWDAPSERVETEDGTRRRRLDPELNGDLGLLLKLSPDVRLGFNVGTAFRLPTPKDRYFVGQTPQGLNVGNPDLKPEHSLNADMVLKFRSRGGAGSSFEGSLAAFINRFRDLIVIRWDRPTGDRVGVFANAGRAEIYGLEGELAAAVEGGWTVSAAVTLMGAAVHGNDEVLDDLPPAEARLSLRKILFGGTLWGAVDLRGALAERRTSAGDAPAAAWAAIGLGAGWRISRVWTLRASLDNLLDASYREFFDLPLVRRRGRSAALSLAAQI